MLMGTIGPLRLMNREGHDCGNMGVFLGIEERMEMPFFERVTEEDALRLMRASRTSDSRKRGSQQGVRE
jgi:hypothetical protein